MKSKKINVLISAVMALAITATTVTPVFAVDRTKTISAKRITIENNVGKKDVIKIQGVKEGMVIKVYDADGQIAMATVQKGKDAIDILVNQLGDEKGEVFITATEKDKLESEPVTKEYGAELISNKLRPMDISVENNVGKPDTVLIRDLYAKDVIKVYEDPDKRILLGTGKTGKDGNLLVNLTKQIRTNVIYVSVTSDNMQESEVVEVEVGIEGVTDDLTDITFTVQNNSGSPDTVTANGLTAKDVVKVYLDKEKKTLLGNATASKDGQLVVKLTSQLKERTKNIYVTVTNYNKKESKVIELAVNSEEDTQMLNLDDVKVQNNAVNPDLVIVKWVQAKATVKVYADKDQKTVLGTAKASKEGELVIKLSSQLSEKTKSVYVTLTEENKRESKVLAVDINEEQESPMLKEEDVLVQNNSGTPDIVIIKKLHSKDTIKIYADKEKKNLLGTAKASKDGDLEIKLAKQLDDNLQSIFVTVANDNKRESAVLEVKIEKELTTEALKKEQVTVQNNAGMPDIVTIKGLVAKDTVNIYADDEKKTLLGTAKANKDGDLEVKLAKQLDENKSSIYLTLKNDGKRESGILEVRYEKEKVTDPLSPKNITIVNNFSDDVILVFNSKEGDTIKIYDTNDVLVGKGTVEKGQKLAIIKVKQLGKNGGKVFLTLTQDSMRESTPVEKEFDRE